ncbi:unnamed protein product, partial [Symbiodinium sp. CCMP2456]
MTSVPPPHRYPRQVHHPGGFAVSMNRFSQTSKIQTSLRAQVRITMQRRAKIWEHSQPGDYRAASPLAIPVSFFLAGGVVPKGLHATTATWTTRTSSVRPADLDV